MSMRKLIIPVVALIAAGCGAERRDFTYCDTTHGCNWGYYCDLTEGVCRLGDAPVQPTPDAPLVGDVSNADLAPDVVDAAVDVPLDRPVIDVMPGVDQAIVDVPAPSDVSLPEAMPIDTRPADVLPPDAPGTCLLANDCTRVEGKPYCLKGRCVSCAEPTGGVSICSGATSVCNSSTGSCVECTQNSECKTTKKSFCAQNKCVGCDDDGARPSGGIADAGVDGGSRNDAGTSVAHACTAAKPICVASDSTTAPALAGQCVGCVTNADCSGTTPICNSANMCEACTNDSQCTSGPKLCLYHAPYNGRCATEAETIYVQNPGCSGSVTGAQGSPFCNTQDALAAVTSSKRIIVLSGSGLFPVTSTVTSGTGPVSLIGRAGATTNAGAFIGIRVTSGEIYVRGLTIDGGGNTGVVVEPGATLRMDRCYVTNNGDSGGSGGGGLLVKDGAGFDIANSVFAKNQAGSMGAAAFGGVYLGSATDSTLPHRFWFNTIADNLQLGIACTNREQTIDASLLVNDSSGEVSNCTLAGTTKSSTLVPSGKAGKSFSTDNRTKDGLSTSKPYHLTGTQPLSPCKDFVTDLTLLPSVPPPITDIDGELRPNGSAYDCGADEYWPSTN
jgi:hypothetical protein